MRRLEKHYSLLISLVMILAISLSNITVNADQNNKRLWGNDRYKTGAAVVEDGWQKSEYAVLVNGENFPDSLSAAVIAKKYNAPLLLTKNNELEGNAKQQLERLGVKNLYIVGGDFVVKPNVEKDLKSLGITTERVSGKDRYATSVAVAEKIGTDNGIILATGLDYADALSIAPIAAKLQMPILLVPKDNVPESIANFIKGKSIPTTYVIGGTDIISDKVANAFPNVDRMTGADKYERNINIIKAFEDKLDFSNTIVASGEGFADALSGSAYAAIGSNPIILIGRNPAAVTKGFIKNKDLKKLITLGGTGVIPDSSLDSLYSDKETTGELKVHYIDVGQGDSILIEQNNNYMLIDGGPNSDENTVVNYLKSVGVKKLEHVIGTHPHEDHIGGLDKVINNFEIGKIIMPKATTTTKTFEDVVTAIKNKGLKITTPKVGDSYNLGNARWEVVAPVSDKYDNLNNYSVVIRLQFGNTTFIFTGDAESLSEGEILQKQLDISADVLKIGHHGSKTSTTQNFLNKVNPKYAVISMAEGNDYGHPHKEVMDKLKAKNIEVYRTDESGTIIATSVEDNIIFNTSPGSYNIGNQNNTTPSVPKPTEPSKPTEPNKPSQTATVYVTANGKAYHKTSTCSNMKKPRAISLQEAQSKGYTPCSKCKP